MDVPGIVETTLAGEDVAAEVSLGGENVLYVTPTRTLIYQSEGFLSDESVDEYPHEAERMTVKEGRRKTRITLTYSLDGERDFTVPANVSESVIHPVLAGVLNASGVTNPGETVTQTFRFSELTVVITSERLVKHVGGAVWDEDYEEYHFADVTGLSFEDGSVATQVVLEVDGRPERIKVANDRAAEVKEYLQQSLFAYYDVNSLDALNDAVRPADVDEEERPSPIDFGEGVDPLDAGNTVQPDEADADLPEESGQPQHAAGQDQHAAGQGGQAPQQADPLAGGPGTGTTAEADQPGRQQDQQSAQPDQQSREQHQQPPQHDQQSARGEQPQQDQQPPRQDDRSSPQDDRQPAASRSQSEPRESRTHSQVESPPEAAEAQPEVEPEPEPAATHQSEQADHQQEPVAPDQHEPDPSQTGQAAGTEPEPGAEPEVADDEDDAASPFEAAGFQPATADATDEAVLERLDRLEEQVQKQNELIERQGALIQQLVDELSRNR
ncbi:DUF7115 domain-containing protein [Haloarchaeobius amylolyticus]|uniref:DUF7115 domain-containing protein n=1 Tax=Haloarchaeobius amylolyticus TaxID=1198296 RepID=UPI00226F4FDC|nr:hypothetical protein [Haloarchaeobius amylolyticus]